MKIENAIFHTPLPFNLHDHLEPYTAVKRHSHFSQMAQCWILPAVAMQLVYHGIQAFVDSKVLFRRT